MCVGLCVDGSTRTLVASQGTLSFPVINCTVRPGIERFDVSQMVKSSAVTLAASKMILVGGTCCRYRNCVLMVPVSQIKCTISTIDDSFIPLEEISTK